MIRIHPRAPGGGLTAAYLAGDLPNLFAHDPFDLRAFRTRLQEVQRRFGSRERELVARALHPTSPRAAERLQRFVRDGGAVVTSGQQAGFLTGPLYTIHKALTVVRLAAELEREFGVVVLPVFWTASEDHDWAEVDHAYLGTRRGLHRVSLAAGDPAAIPMSRRVVEEGVESTLSEVMYALAQHGDIDAQIKSVLDAYQPGRTVAGAFNMAMEALFAPFDLLLTDAADPAVKEGSVEVLARALRDAPEHERLLRERGDELREAGYVEQVAILEGATNVFHDGSGERERLYRHGERLITASRSLAMTLDEALERLAEEPGRFSPNVLLRPVVESAVFPTLAYVAGPGEISYYAQVGVLYGEFGMGAPVVYPRFSATLVEERVERELSRGGLTLETVARPRHQLVEEIARRAMPGAVDERIAALGEEVADRYRDLIDTAAAIDPTLTGALGRLRNESLARVGGAERKILRALKRREKEAIGRVDRLREALYPFDGPQERTLNVLPFLAAEPELLSRLLDAIEIRLSRAGEGTGRRALKAI